MRKIEREMLNAIHDGKNWKKDNTRVVSNDLGQAVHLHGTPIAVKLGDWRINWEYFGHMPEAHSMTTASRLRALGFNVHLRNGRLVEE